MTPGQPHVTVATITYNHEKYIASAIESILNQTFEDFELIVVDDGSTDATAAIIQGFNDPRIRYIWQENQGPSGARNTAIRAARGQLLAQMSGDDIAVSTRLERQVEQLQAMPDHLIFSHCRAINDLGEQIENPGIRNFNRENWSREKTLRHFFLEGNCFLAPSAMAATKHFRAIGPYRPELLQAQDYDMWVRFLLAGHDAFIIQEPLLHYRIRSDGNNLSFSSANHNVIQNRFFQERRLITRQFLAIRSAKRLAAIFPEIASMAIPIEDDLTAFLLAMLLLRPEHRNTFLPHYGAEILMELMGDARHRTILSQKAGFSTQDLFRLLGAVEAPGQQLRIQELEAAIAALHHSASWRLTRPLRRLATGIRNLRQGLTGR